MNEKNSLDNQHDVAPQGWSTPILAACLLLFLAGCGDPSVTASSQDVGACVEEPHWHLNQAGVMDQLTSWWIVDVDQAFTGGGAGERSPDSRARSLDREAFSAIVDLAENPQAAFYLLNRDFEMARSRGGRAIVGSRNFGGESHAIDVFALVEPDGSLRFVGNCATRFFTETFTGFVAEAHPGMTEEQVLLDMTASGDFTLYDDWLVGPQAVPWVERDSRFRQINPEDTRVEDHDNLRETAIEWRIPGDWARIDASVCTWTPMGWNTCVSFGAAEQGLGNPIVTEHYVVPGEPLELWLLDGNANFDSPVSQLIATLSSDQVSDFKTLSITFHDAPDSLESLLQTLRSGDTSLVTITTK